MKQKSKNSSDSASVGHRVFGDHNPHIVYRDRSAAYAVILSEDGPIAVVKSGRNYFLPGGGMLPNETAVEAVIREIREELGKDARLIKEIGRAIQYFHASPDDCDYRMEATFFLAELTETVSNEAEHELQWLAPAEACDLFFHQCHAWAVGEAFATK